MHGAFYSRNNGYLDGILPQKFVRSECSDEGRGVSVVVSNVLFMGGLDTLWLTKPI